MFSNLGAEEFQRCTVDFSQVLHIRDENLEIGSTLAASVYWHLKKTLISIVWGYMFPTHSPRFFKRIMVTDDNSNFSLVDLVIPEGARLTKFVEGKQQKFTLSDVFVVELSNDTKMHVLFEEEVLINFLYTDSSFYSAVDQEFCLVFDIFYAKSGTEAVVESFYWVVDNQEMGGVQSTQVLMKCAKVDCCFPSVLQCDSAHRAMANMYINGDKERGLSRHHIPVFKDRHSWRTHETGLSKVL